MSVAPTLTRPARGGRHRSVDGAPTTDSFAALTAELGELVGTSAPSERTGGARHAAPTAALSRAARTAGFSLAALGALAGAGGVATQGLGDDPAPTGQTPTLAAADLAVAPAPSVAEPAALTAPAVLPAAKPSTPSTSSSTASASPTKAAPASSKDSDDADDDASASDSGSSTAAQAVAAAKSKLGKPYVWGSTGPNSFDCSGLMLWSYKQAGKSLPRTSKAQSTTGTKVSMDDLQPGDLIFLYSPVSHVVMYIGDGKVIEAPTSGKNVRIKPLSSVEGRAVGARRVA